MSSSESQNLVEDILLHLAHADSRYPGGVPSDDLGSTYAQAQQLLAENAVEAAAEYDLAFVLTTSAAGLPAGADGELLKAIVEKGLNRSIASVLIVGDDAILAELPAKIVIFGEAVATSLGLVNWQQGQWQAERGKTFLCADSLQDIRTSVDKKRIFWKQLQSLL